LAGAVFVLIVLAAQTRWMGSAIVFSQWSDARFVTFNMLWLAAFVLAGLGVYRRVRSAYLIVIFLALIGGVGMALPIWC
jgi:hypothetical protein